VKLGWGNAPEIIFLPQKNFYIATELKRGKIKKNGVNMGEGMCVY
jgi:hypothetical protein